MLNFENDILLLLQVIYNLKNLMQSYQPFLFSPDLNLYTPVTESLKKKKKIQIMDPCTCNSAHNVSRCHVCETPVPPLYCDTCHINLCKTCVGEHHLDESKFHIVVPAKHRKSIPRYPKCPEHIAKVCELFIANYVTFLFVCSVFLPRNIWLTMLLIYSVFLKA